MKPLYKYIENKFKLDNKIIDAHVHLFDHLGTLDYYRKFPEDISYKVGFMDIDFAHIKDYENSLPYYQNYIEKHLDDKTILLATGINPDNIIAIYQAYPELIKGFGELKCYSHWVHGELPFGDPFYFEKVYEFDKELGLPIYIHWNLKDETAVKRFEEVLNRYPTIPFVLCHCGMSDDAPCEFTFKWIKTLLSRYSNLYVDVSYTAEKWFEKNKIRLEELQIGRVLFGSDMNPILYRNHHPAYSYKKLYKQYEKLQPNIAFHRLFTERGT